ncbi:MAG: hypothetical protein AAGG75_05630 [Bacteroidota bacterium]
MLNGSEKPNNIILTGVPRSGTTLACFLLSQLPETLALNEPMSLKGSHDRPSAVQLIDQFYAETRQSVLEKGEARARATLDGKMTDNNFAVKQGQRTKLVQKQTIKIDKSLQPDFTLIIKHNALFTLLLPLLKDRYPTYAIIRNPIAILGSWNTVDVPVSRGQIRAARKLMPELQDRLDSIENVYERQLLLLSWYFEQYDMLSEQQLIRYESIVETAGRALEVIVPEAQSFIKPLESKNHRKIYSSKSFEEVAERLLASEGAYWKYYSKEDVRQVLKQIKTA